MLNVQDARFQTKQQNPAAMANELRSGPIAELEKKNQRHSDSDYFITQEQCFLSMRSMRGGLFPVVNIALLVAPRACYVIRTSLYVIFCLVVSFFVLHNHMVASGESLCWQFCGVISLCSLNTSIYSWD